MGCSPSSSAHGNSHISSSYTSTSSRPVVPNNNSPDNVYPHHGGAPPIIQGLSFLLLER